MLGRLRGTWAALLIFAGVVACAAGLLIHRADLPLPRDRLVDTGLLAVLAVAAASPLRFALRWSWANALAAVWFAALIAFCGVLPVAAAILIVLAAAAIGVALVPAQAPARGVLAVGSGLALIGGTAAWLLMLPIHRWYVYLVVLLAACVWRRRALQALAAEAWRSTQSAVANAPWAATYAVLLVGLASTGAWLPTAQGDDLAYHLALPSELARYGFYAPDPSHQIWALAPWFGDVVQGIAQVLAGREARGAVDMLWLVLAAAGTWGLVSALGGDVRTRWISVAALASMPLLASLTAGMHTELPATALVIVLALAILQGREHSLLVAGSVLAGALVALKFAQLVAALVLGVWALAHTRARVDRRRVPLASALFVLTAASSYAYAAWISGNPFLPLFNQVFRSPVMAARQLDDPRWHAGFGVDLPWSITFDTQRYLEALNGGFGFVLVLLAGAWIVALIRPATRGAALAASAITLLPLVPMQYARYAFPGVALLLPVLLVSVRAELGARRFLWVAIPLCAVNLAYHANASWSLYTVARNRFARHGGDADEVFRRFAPERMLIKELRTRDDGDSIVLASDPDAPFVAELGRRGRNVAWYDPELEKARRVADADSSGEYWRQIFADVRARWVLSRPQHASAALTHGLERANAELIASVGDAQLWLLPAAVEAP